VAHGEGRPCRMRLRLRRRRRRPARGTAHAWSVMTMPGWLATASTGPAGIWERSSGKRPKVPVPSGNYGPVAVRGGSYWPVAALNLTTRSAGTRPRSFTSMPCSLAHSRTSVVLRPLADPRRPPRAGRLAVLLTRLAAPM
jgi:hypothetical protein